MKCYKPPIGSSPPAHFTLTLHGVDMILSSIAQICSARKGAVWLGKWRSTGIQTKQQKNVAHALAPPKLNCWRIRSRSRCPGLFDLVVVVILTCVSGVWLLVAGSLWGCKQCCSSYVKYKNLTFESLLPCILSFFCFACCALIIRTIL